MAGPLRQAGFDAQVLIRRITPLVKTAKPAIEAVAACIQGWKKQGHVSLTITGPFGMGNIGSVKIELPKPKKKS